MDRSTVKRMLGPELSRELGEATRLLKRGLERIKGGGERREKVLVELLEYHYDSLYRRQWTLGGEEPHFFDHRIGMFNFAFTSRCAGPHPYFRGFYSSEVIEEGNTVLDIGCGDGFFTRRFLASKASSVDAIDIEESAISAASQRNAGPNIRYQQMDAVKAPFPRSAYDVVVWDGALGHFSAETLDVMLAKIAAAVGERGVFTGSESLGHEGHDHLQFFETEKDLHAVFSKYFKTVQLKSSSYPASQDGGLVRREAYWRCCQSRERLERAGWHSF